MAGGAIPRTGFFATTGTALAALDIVGNTTDLTSDVTKVGTIVFIGNYGNTNNVFIGGSHATDHLGVPLPPGGTLTLTNVNITNFYVSTQTLGNIISWVIIE